MNIQLARAAQRSAYADTKATGQHNFPLAVEFLSVSKASFSVSVIVAFRATAWTK